MTPRYSVVYNVAFSFTIFVIKDYFWIFYGYQIFLDLIPEQHDKVAIVTGANKGIGYATAKALCKLGAHVIMGKRM